MYDIRITENDKYLFKLLNKFVCLNQEVALLYLGLSESWWRNRTIKLEEYGYIKGHQRDIQSEKIIYITDKGMNVIFDRVETISKTGRTYFKYERAPSFNPYKVNHEIIVAKTCFYILKRNKDLEIDDILTDREQRQLLYTEERSYSSYDKISDLYIPEKLVRIEVELTLKSNMRLHETFDRILNEYTLFVIPQNKKAIRKRIETEQNRNFILDYIYIKDIETYEFDISKMYEKTLEDYNREDQDNNTFYRTNKNAFEVEQYDSETGAKLREELLKSRTEKPIEKPKEVSKKPEKSTLTRAERIAIIEKIHGKKE